MKTTILTIFLLASLGASAQSFIKVADSIRKSRFVASLSYAVMSTDGIIESANVGYIKLRSKDTVTENARYHLGGNAIHFVSYIAAQLVQQGKIKWNTKLVDVFPDLKKTAKGEYKVVTLVDLLSQRAGIPKYNVYTDFVAPIFNGDNVAKRKSFTVWITQRRSLYDSATGKFPLVYSNASAVVATAMLEKVSGKPYEQLLESYISKPFRIHPQYSFPNRTNPKEPWGHTDETRTFQPAPPDHWWRMPVEMQPSCDINLPIKDYAVFILDQLRGLRGGKAKMPKRTYELLHYAYPEYAIGWGNLEINGNHISEHDGTLNTYYCHVEIHKEKNLAIIVMCNNAGTPGKAAVLNLSKYIREHYFQYKNN